MVGSGGKEMGTVPNAKRVYQVWKGNNRFFCGGRLIFGPDVASVVLTVLLIAVPAIVFCCQIATKIHKDEKILNQKEGGNRNHILTFPIFIITVITMLSDLIFLLLTSSRDPGIVPRNARPPESQEVFEANTPSMEWVNGRTPHLRLPRTKDVIVNGHAVKVKYCDTCMLYRPPRASHCSICNNCVQKFDHHCPWVGQCIGLRNYPFFFLFISTSTFLCIYVFILSWLNIIEEKKNYHNSVWKSMTGEVISLVLIAYTFIAVWFVGGLSVFHAYLISTNQTTYENFRYRYDKKDNPYNHGILRNFKELFFSKIQPSMNDFRSWTFEEIEEIGPLTPNIGTDAISSKEKLDIEMGSELELDGAPIPSILQNLDYTAIDCEILNENDTHKDGAIDPFVFPDVQEPTIQGPTESKRSHILEDEMSELQNIEFYVDATSADQHGRAEGDANGMMVVASIEEGSNCNTTSGSADQNVHIART